MTAFETVIRNWPLPCGWPKSENGIAGAMFTTEDAALSPGANSTSPEKTVATLVTKPDPLVDAVTVTTWLEPSPSAPKLMTTFVPVETTVPEDVVALAQQLRDAPRHLGIHSGGMVICDRPVIEVCPVEWGRMRQRSVLQWDKDDCAAAGLVKFDLLGVEKGPVVSEAAASQMARGVCRVLACDVGVALTGVAGPSEQDGMPVGTLRVGLVVGSDPPISATYRLPGQRQQMREFSVISAPSGSGLARRGSSM